MESLVLSCRESSLPVCFVFHRLHLPIAVDDPNFCVGSQSGLVSSNTSGVLEHKWRASLKLHYCSMIDFNN